MEVVPAIDLLKTDAVRLYQGDFSRVTWRRPALEHLEHLLAAGASRLHIVDLDGARLGSIRVDLVRRLIALAGAVPVQVAGGIRSPAVARTLVDAGADRVIIGTAAFAGEDALGSYVRAVASRLVVAIDVRDGYVTVRGWQQDTALSVDSALERCRNAGVGRILCTAVDRDGTLAGPDLELLRVVAATGIPVMAAGGIRSAEDLVALAEIGCDAAIVGTAIVSYPEALLT